jgi:hypothetical protein
MLALFHATWPAIFVQVPPRPLSCTLKAAIIRRWNKGRWAAYLLKLLAFAICIFDVPYQDILKRRDAREL